MRPSSLPHGLHLVAPSDAVGTPARHGPGIQELISGRSSPFVPASGLSAALLTLPVAQTARAHVHEYADALVWILSGCARTVFGPALEEHVDTPAGTTGPILFIPAGVPHAAVNLSSTEPVTALEVRSCRGFADDVVLLDHLEEIMADWRNRTATEVAGTSAGAHA